MRLTIVTVSALALLCAGFCFPITIPSPQDDGPRPIKEIMGEAMKGGLAKKVAAGNASDEDKKKLLDLLIDLVANDPPQGDATEWKMQAGTAMMMAAKVVVGRDGAEKELREATNCKACHDKFKPKSP